MGSPEERSSHKFNQIEYLWESNHLKTLAVAISGILGHNNSLSQVDLVMIKAAHHFVYDVGVALRMMKSGERPTQKLLKAYTLASAAYGKDDLRLNRALGASMNIFNRLQKANSTYRLTAVEIARSEDFFTKLALSLTKEP